mmetsp:Transcript_26606/g.53332  ORF Transcript_26606/g.53332 Transcript_26606/m.53332 type:complete len:414 (+) Transcript_26606:38-1279(+)
MAVASFNDSHRSTAVLNTAAPSDAEGQESDLATYHSSSYDEGYDAAAAAATFGDDEAAVAGGGGIWSRRNKLLMSLIAGSAFLCAVSTGGAAAYKARMANANSSSKCFIDELDLVAVSSGASSKASKSLNRRDLIEATVDEEAIMSTGAYYPDAPKMVEDKRADRMGEGKTQYVRGLSSGSSSKSTKSPSSSSKAGKAVNSMPLEIPCDCVQYYSSSSSAKASKAAGVSGSGKATKSPTTSSAKSAKSTPPTMPPSCMLPPVGSKSAKSSTVPGSKSSKSSTAHLPAPLPAPLPAAPTPEQEIITSKPTTAPTTAAPTPKPTPIIPVPIEFPTGFPKVKTDSPTYGSTVTVGDEATTAPTPIREEITTFSPTSVATDVATPGVTVTVSTETTGPPTTTLRVEDADKKKKKDNE